MGTTTFDYRSQVVLVTGGTRGVGRQIATRFERSGARVVVCARSVGDVPLPATWAFVAADIRDGEQAAQMVDTVIDTHGRLDVVVNNAGGSPPVDTTSASHRFSERIIALNLLAPIYVSQRANHHMQARDGGAIVNIGSIAAQRPAPTVAAYGAAKAGLASFTMTAAQEWAPKVRVNIVTPGLVLTDHAALHYGDAASMDRIVHSIPAGRLATPDDIAEGCLFLASSAAAYITGANLVMHGGGDRPAFLRALDG